MAVLEKRCSFNAESVGGEEQDSCGENAAHRDLMPLDDLEQPAGVERENLAQRELIQLDGLFGRKVVAQIAAR
jgi:hypothetical protein